LWIIEIFLTAKTQRRHKGRKDFSIFFLRAFRVLSG